MATNYDRALSALQALDPGTNRQTWVRIAMAAKDAGLQLQDFTEWSSHAANFGSDKECRILWDSIKDGGVKAATLYGMARDRGWKDPGKPRQTPAEALSAVRHRSASLRIVKRPIEALRPPQVAATDLWERCHPASSDHPYIARKLGRPEGLRVVPDSEPLSIQGNRVAGWLAIPAWSSDGALRTIQLIPPGEKQAKLNLPGHTFSDGALWVGNPDTTTRLYVVEGIGQAWAVTTAERDSAAVVSFGSGRMLTVAERTRSRYPTKPLVIVADRGKEGDAEEIAKRCNGSWVAMPDDKPVNYDANDLLIDDGPEALAAHLQHHQVPNVRFRLKAADELMKAPALAWLVRGVIPSGGLACIYGASGSGKSFLALDLCAAVADGTEWFGRRVTSAPVVYVALEGEHGLRQRAQAWQTHHDRPIPSRLRFVMAPLDLREPKDREEMAQAVKASGAAGGLLVIDTLNRAAGGADENSSRDMGEIIDASKDLLTRLGGTVLLIHHSGKDQTKGLRGHSSLHAALDAAIEVSRSDDRREWRIAKNKDDGDSAAHPFRLHVVELGNDDHGEPITSCVVAEDDAAEGGRQRLKHPHGPTQKLVHEALGHLLRASSDYGRAGAPASRPCIDIEAAVMEAAKRLTCRTDQRPFQARRAINAMTSKGLYGVKDGWLWDAQ